VVLDAFVLICLFVFNSKNVLNFFCKERELCHINLVFLIIRISCWADNCLFGGRRNVEVTKFAFEDFTFVVGSAANSVGTTLEFAAFRSGPNTRYSASAFCFFVSTAMVFVAVRTHFPRKTPASLVDRAAINKQLFKY